MLSLNCPLTSVYGQYTFPPKADPPRAEKIHCLGAPNEEVTPDPIPNSAVKLFSADDSVIAKVGRRQDNGFFNSSKFADDPDASVGINSVIAKVDSQFTPTLRRGTMDFLFSSEVKK